ncbi:MAG: polyketide cyclase [Panacagrimonas sp.]|nr:polyketide cyclase [Panacagrimonas sp.]
MLKILLLVVVIAVLGVLALAYAQPDEFRVERSARIKAAPGKVYDLIADLHRWSAWSPWEKKDPAMQRSFTGAEHGVGAQYAWDGNKNVGQGSMLITEAAPSSRVAIDLDFVKPFEGHNKVVFTLSPDGDSTVVNWAMAGPMPFISKLICLFVNMDRMIGKDFETGLANLKAAAESA